MVLSRLDIGFALDRQWYVLRGEMESTKRPALIALAKVLDESQTLYAIIGGVAVQVHRTEPRTTLDIEVAVERLDMVPRAKLQAAGFRLGGRFVHSENWLGPDSVPVQFTDDAALASALHRTIDVDLDGVRIRVMGRTDLLHEKLRAGSDPARRRSKRLQDLADAQGLLEESPDLRADLSEHERAILDALPS
ncbi:MAG: hypothetical protein EXR58_01180 [Chloroflexi bacterium]|nr:hypothetical protein [Chloroflexota bacterium]